MTLTTRVSYEVVESYKDLLNKFSSVGTGPVVFDLETTGLSITDDKILFLAIKEVGLNTPVYILHQDYKMVLDALKGRLIAHNFKFDLGMLRITTPEEYIFIDTCLCDHLVDENRSHALGNLIELYFQDNYKTKFWEEKNLALSDKFYEYAAKDVAYTEAIYLKQQEYFLKSNHSNTLIKHIHQLAFSLYKMERQGICIDINYLTALKSTLETDIKILKTSLREVVDIECEIIENEKYALDLDKRKTERGRAGVKKEVFNFDSSKQVGALLANQLNLPIKTTEKGNPSVDDASLELIEDQHPFIPILRNYREKQKLFTSFIEGTIERARDNVVYPEFHVSGTKTGRLSSSNPNLQQLPRAGGIRGIYKPIVGHVFISADYSQLEVMMAAHFSRDDKLLEIITTGKSQHDITNEALDLNNRNLAKTLNFAMQYRCSVYKVMKILSCDLKQATKVYNKYWATYNKLRDFMLSCDETIKNKRPLITPFGRKRFLNIENMSPSERDSAFRQGSNFMFQSTGADVTNKAYYTVDQYLRANKWGRALFPIHDEILIEVKKDTALEASKALKTIMETAGDEIKLSVDLKAEVSEPMGRWED